MVEAQDIVRQRDFAMSSSRKKICAATNLALVRHNFVGSLCGRRRLCLQMIESRAICMRVFDALAFQHHRSRQAARFA